ncbi:MAG: hypothetical protein AB7F35_29025 [Acetobacteraceae bacterium]
MCAWRWEVRGSLFVAGLLLGMLAVGRGAGMILRNDIVILPTLFSRSPEAARMTTTRTIGSFVLPLGFSLMALSLAWFIFLGGAVCQEN